MENIINVSEKTAAIERRIKQDELNQLRDAAEVQNLEIHSNVPYDGDCLFASVLKLLPGVAWDTHALRQQLVDFFADKEVCILPL